MIVLGILKTVGIILLVILALILIILALILFVPVRYKGRFVKDGTTEDKADVTVKITWLLHLLSAEVTPLADKKYAVKLAGITVKSDKAKNKKKPEKKTKVKKQPEKVTEKIEETENNKADISILQERSETSVKHTKREALSGIIQKIKEILGKVRFIGANVKKWCSFLSDPDNREGIIYVLSGSGKLIKKIIPKKIEGDVDFGLDDPASTGQALAVLSVLYPIYGNSIRITPYFEDKILQGNLGIAGRLHLINVVILGVRVLTHKNSMNVIKYVRGQF